MCHFSTPSTVSPSRVFSTGLAGARLPTKQTPLSKPASFNFKANIEGRFTVESHVGDVQIGEISVNP